VILRRRRLPEHLQERSDAFWAVIEPLERGKAALPDAMPTTRLPGRPLAEVLLEFEEGLRAASAGMDGWRAPEVEAEWQACGAALERTLDVTERLRVEAPDPGGFEGLVGLLGDLLAPLEAFEHAASRFRALRS
jgi:hypothetical protein